MGKTFGKLYLFTFIIAAVAALFVALGYKYKLAILTSSKFYLHRAYGQNHLSELFHHHN
jgi:hypothetical protein